MTTSVTSLVKIASDSDRDTVYTVDLNNGYACNCKGFKAYSSCKHYKRVRFQHLYFVQGFIARTAYLLTIQGRTTKQDAIEFLANHVKITGDRNVINTFRYVIVSSLVAEFNKVKND